MSYPDELKVQKTEPDDWEEDEHEPLLVNVVSYPTDWTLKGYYDKFKNKQLLIPAFQRQYVWDLKRASKLIESFLLNIPVPSVFLRKERDTNLLQVIDGNQRIQSYIRFRDGRFGDGVFGLKGVSRRWEGKKFDDLDEADRLQLDDSVLRATVIQDAGEDNEKSIYAIYERLNSGGVALSQMELRKCIYHGKFYDQIERLNKDDSWRKLLGKAKIETRLRDVELLLRALAMSEWWCKYEKPMKEFLSNYMSWCSREAGDAHLVQLDAKFLNATELIASRLPDRAFHLRGPLNMAVMDSVMHVFMEFSKELPPDIEGRYHTLVRDIDYLDSVSKSTSDKATVLKRFELARKVLVGR